MERALNPELLSEALGRTGRLRTVSDELAQALPSPEELANLLASAEISLLLGRPQIADELIAVGWHLHGVASSRYALETYGIERQRAAFKVAAHIFDLVLRLSELHPLDRLRYCFATQVAYLRSELDPNALALYQREVGYTPDASSLPRFSDELALHAGIALLGMRLGAIFTLARQTRNEITRLLESWGLDSIFATPLGAPVGVVLGAGNIAYFLRDGNSEMLERARQTLRLSIAADMAFEYRYSRWVAAHLLQLADDLPNASIWTKLPPEVPPAARRAFTFAQPPILTLWPPQLDLVDHARAGVPNPFGNNVQRLFLSLPVSSGKTLLAQLIILHHLTTKSTGVIYVAPTRSLCREVRDALASRLRFLNKSVGYDSVDFVGLENLLEDKLDVEVMTPERLAALLRANSTQVLDRTGLFVFDEVHNVNDGERGWTLEFCISFLHYATRNTQHKIVLISPSIGNQFHFIEWLKSVQSPIHLPTHDWRGPRRITGIWTTQPKWDESHDAPTRRDGTPQKDVPMYERLEVRVGAAGQHFSLGTTAQVGTMRVTQQPGEFPHRVPGKHSTQHYRMLVPLIKRLGVGGPVLIFEAQKKQAILTAKAIAESCTPTTSRGLSELIRLVETRLGSLHPLCEVIPKGVAFHYGPLPDEIRNAIEDAFKRGDLRYLVATTTVAEGVNLPCRAVVIANIGTHTSDGQFNRYLTGSKLINAIGRAGRAAKETEGIVVLAIPGEPQPDDVNLLFPNDADLTVKSRLKEDGSLKAAEDLQNALRTAGDSVIDWAASEIDDFMAFVWFMADYLDQQGQALAEERLDDVLKFTLAWHQLDIGQQAIWRDIAANALARYFRTPVATRRRWATSGASLKDATILDEVTRSLVETLQSIPLPADSNPVGQIQLVLADGRLEKLLGLAQAPKNLQIYRQRNAKEVVQLSMEKLIERWLRGDELKALANSFFQEVKDIGYRYEQLTDFIYRGFEVYLPGILSTVVNWTNELLRERNMSIEIPKALPAYIRWGISNPIALDLMVNGLGSRTLAMRIAQEFRGDTDDLRTWLRSLTVADWQVRFDTMPNDLRRLLEFVREQRGGIIAQFHENKAISINVQTDLVNLLPTPVTIKRESEDEFAPLVIFLKDRRVGRVNSQYHSDIIGLQNGEIPFEAILSVDQGKGALEIRAVESVDSSGLMVSQ